MKLYIYESGIMSDRFQKKVIDVEEKAKTFIHSRRRIKKDDINQVKSSFSSNAKLYLVEENDQLAREKLADHWKKVKEKHRIDFEKRLKEIDQAMKVLEKDPELNDYLF